MRGIRGAVVAEDNSPEAIRRATRELLQAMVELNEASVDDIVAVFFTVTSDLDRAFPASAVRELGWTHVPLLDAMAPPVADDLPRCIRALVLVNTDRSPAEIRHVYLGAARCLRPDLAGREAAGTAAGMAVAQALAGGSRG
ncbi:MAG: chorismate mutase [Bacillota bacterium]|nr:MAG: chorismate mutase [Bacillota bacterium]